MNDAEEKYQLGIRQLSKHDLVTLVIAYRNKLKGCRELCKAFAQENYAQQPLHKVTCAHMEADLNLVINDYEWAIKRGI